MQEIQLNDRDFDVIIIGTSMSQCILSAALARAGKKIMHIDGNRWYGSSHSTLTLDEFASFMSSMTQSRYPAYKDEWKRLY